MITKYILLFLLSFPFKGYSERINLIIDTDCAFDDFQALNIFLSRPEVNICAVIVSEGTLKAEEGAEKVSSLLHDWNADSIPVIVGKKINGHAPAWRDFNRKIEWGPSRSSVKSSSFDFFRNFSQSDVTFTMVCMGTLHSALILYTDYPEFFSRIKRVVWYTDSVYPPQGFNYEYDPISADAFLKNGPVRLDVVSNLGYPEMKFQEEFRNNLPVRSVVIQHLNFVYEQPAVKEKMKENHFFFHDELLPVYIFNPELFSMTVKLPETKIRHAQSYNIQSVKEALTDLIEGSYTFEKNVVFNSFPARREFFNYDVRQIMDTAIGKYGYEEWKACVITDEFHGHLGIFSIVGAKMGIRAREYFQVGPDNMTVVSFAGLTPPYSCLTDGIQVSTGATLGQGTIRVSEDSLKRPEAVFTCFNRSVKISLKKEYLDRINRDINEGIIRFGLSDDGYWKMVRQAALRYWVEWDRNEIFEITEL